MNRDEIAARARELVGGPVGYTKHFDPQGYFKLVTEGRQTTWVDAKTRKKRSYSACQDLATRLALEACDMKQGMSWCNRVDGGNKWIAGINLIRIKQHASYSWLPYGPKTGWDIQTGDAVEVMGKYGPHTFVVTALEYQDGKPARCDHADYGQFFDPDGPDEPEPMDHGCRLYTAAPIARTAAGWTIGGAPVIGRLDIMLLRLKELGPAAKTIDNDASKASGSP